MMRQIKKQSCSYNLMSFPSLKYTSCCLLGSHLQIKLAFDASWCQKANIFNTVEIIMQTARGHCSNFLYGDVLHPFSCTHCLPFRSVWNGKDFWDKLLSKIAPLAKSSHAENVTEIHSDFFVCVEKKKTFVIKDTFSKNEGGSVSVTAIPRFSVRTSLDTTE